MTTDPNAHVTWYVFWGNNETLSELEEAARAHYTCTRCGHTLQAHPDGGCATPGCSCRPYLGDGPSPDELPFTGNDASCDTLAEVLEWVRSESALLQLDPSLTPQTKHGVAAWPRMLTDLIPGIRADGEGGYSLDHTIGHITLGLWEQPRWASKKVTE